MFSKSDLRRLEDQASDFVSECRPNFRTIEVFYRNKPEDYFTEIQLFHGGIMRPLLKDNNGDPHCPANGRIKGLFFMGKKHGRTLPDKSPFGERRVMVPAGNILNDNSKLYFSDFWCHKEVHYVSLVITRRGTQADRFCQQNLLELDIKDNRYLKVNYGMVSMLHGNTFWIEIFYTEPINIKSPDIKFSTVEIIGRGVTTPGGIKKKRSCTRCNISSSPSSTVYSAGYSFESAYVPAYTPPRVQTPSHSRVVTPQPSYVPQPVRQEPQRENDFFSTVANVVGRAIASVWNWFT